ncbi:MFS transporter [Magnetospirillum sp. UT-4]|uniref:MFS transporter n=1 Tax=Magnetospirillum sp. UT-4 TaxID=2681467 RepID=UPI00137D834C|nr:MFS transporter [Magnetospirillum sp. UT-4]CAA7613947.1 putative Monocarboxylate transporter [Magnetospirillum sp. UT-4]
MSALKTVLPVLAVTTTAQALVALAMLTLPAIAPEMAPALGVPARLVGWWISLSYGMAMLTSLMGAVLVRRLGAARTTQLALLLMCAGTLANAVAWLPAILAGAVLVGLGYGMTNPAASHLLAQRAAARHRNLVFSIKQTGVPLGGTVAGLMAPALTVAFGWQAAPAAVAVLGLGLAAAVMPARAAWDADRDPTAPLKANPFEGLAVIWRAPALRGLSLAGFAYAAVQLSLSTFLVTMLVADLGWTLVEAGLLLSAVQVTGVAGRILSGLVADRLAGGRPTLIGLGLFTAGFAVATGALAAGSPVVAVYGVLVCYGTAALGWNGVYLAEVAHAAPPGQIPRVTGASLFFTYGGVLVGPPAFAALQGLTGSYTATYALAAIPALAGAALLAWRR